MTKVIQGLLTYFIEGSRKPRPCNYTARVLALKGSVPYKKHVAGSFPNNFLLQKQNLNRLGELGRHLTRWQPKAGTKGSEPRTQGSAADVTALRKSSKSNWDKQRRERK